MDIDRKKLFSKYLLDIVVIIFLVSGIMLMVYQQKGIHPFGKGNIAYADMVQQTIPENLYYMWDVLHGKANAFFSWNSGLGINISGAASEQAFLSPLNLFILFSSRDNLLNFINILLIIKMVCIAISMYTYLGKYRVTGLCKIGAGVLYAFGASSLIHYNLMFVMDMAFLLPLLMIGYNRIFTKEKCGLFIMVCTFCLIENVYMSFMVLLFVLLVSGLQLLFDIKEVEGKGQYAFLLGASVTVSTMMSAAIALPVLLAISQSSRVQETFLDIYIKAIATPWGQGDWDMAKFMLMNLTFPLVTCIYELIHNKNRKLYKKQVILVVLVLIPIVVSGTELLWHGGSRVGWPIRFAFVVSFVIIDFAIELMQDRNYDSTANSKIKIWDCLCLVLVTILCTKVIYCMCLRLPDINRYREMIYMVMFFSCGIGHFILIYKRKQVSMKIVLIICELSLTAYLFVPFYSHNTDEYSLEYVRDSQSISNAIGNLQKPFERIKNNDGKISNANYALIMGKESIANYLHVIDGAFQPVLRQWGYSTHWTRLLDTGGTIFTDTLLGIQYVINGSELPEVLYDKISECDSNLGIHYYIYRNKYHIPLVTYLENTPEIFTDNIFENQNILFRAVTDSEKKLIAEYDGIKVNENFLLAIEGRKILYFYGDENQTISIKMNGKDVEVPDIRNVNNLNYPSGYNNNLICLGYYENQSVMIEFANVQNAAGVHLGIFDVGTFEEGIDSINNKLQRKVEINRSNTGVRIGLESDKDGYVFVPVLYDKGWECKVNGNRDEVQDIFGFLKVHVQKGNNLICLEYVQQGWKTGVMISSMGGILCALFVGLYDRRVQHLAFVQSVSYYLLMTVFGGIMVLFYTIPIIKYFERLFIF